LPSLRYRLYDGDLLRTLMRRAPGGQSLHVRELATMAGVSKSKVGSLLSGVRPTVDAPTATRIAEALGVHIGALFDAGVSTSTDADIHQSSQEDTDGSARALPARPAGRTHQLGEHP
jgi:Helix-turn-helix.